mgnify:CR=1 FL=1
MEDITSKFTVEEIYLVRTCNLVIPDKDRIISELKDYLDLEGMKEIVRGVIGKLEYATGEELKRLWEYPLD